MTRTAARWSFAAALLLGVPDGAQASLPVPGALCGGQAGLPDWFAPGVYSGTLGNERIFLQLKAPAEDGDEVGAYAYAGKKVSLTLRGARQGRSLVLAESVWTGSGKGFQTTGCLLLSKSGPEWPLAQPGRQNAGRQSQTAESGCRAAQVAGYAGCPHAAHRRSAGLPEAQHRLAAHGEHHHRAADQD